MHSQITVAMAIDPSSKGLIPSLAQQKYFLTLEGDDNSLSALALDFHFAIRVLLLHPAQKSLH